MATHSSILAWRIPWTEELGGLQSMGSQRVDMTERLSTHIGRCGPLSGSPVSIVGTSEEVGGIFLFILYFHNERRKLSEYKGPQWGGVEGPEGKKQKL